MRNKSGIIIGGTCGTGLGLANLFLDGMFGHHRSKKETAVMFLAFIGTGALGGKIIQSGMRGVIKDFKNDFNHFFHRSSPVGKAIETSKDHSIKP
jgi:hypothetical protein